MPPIHTFKLLISHLVSLNVMCEFSSWLNRTLTVENNDGAKTFDDLNASKCK